MLSRFPDLDRPFHILQEIVGTARPRPAALRAKPRTAWLSGIAAARSVMPPVPQKLQFKDFFLVLLHDHPLSDSGKQAGKTKSRPVFPTWAERARVLQEMPRNGRLAAIRAAAIRALRRVAAGRLQRPRQRPAAGCGQGGDDGRDRTERTPVRHSGRISGVDRDRYREKCRNVKEKSEKIGEISKTCPGAAAPAKRNTPRSRSCPG